LLALRIDALSHLCCVSQGLNGIIFENFAPFKPLNSIGQALCEKAVVVEGSSDIWVLAIREVQRINEELIDDADALVKECIRGLRGSLFIPLDSFLEHLSGRLVDKLAN
jgi:hypothetical protein